MSKKTEGGENDQIGGDDQQQEEGEGQRRELTPAEAAILELMKRGGGAAANSVLTTQQRQLQQEEGPRRHAFWDTQPMPHQDSNESLPEGPIVPGDVSTIRPTPYNMPPGFEWTEVDVTEPTQLQELYDLLYSNYVEDDDCLFRFDYSKDFLRWALTPPGARLDFWVGVRSSKSHKLVAFISAIPAHIRVVHHERVAMVEINFLCVHKKLRSKRLAPVLIKEITRRVNLTGVFSAVYTAGVVLPVPVAEARYYHRSLNPKKLISVGFSRLPPRMTMARMQKLYKLPQETKTRGLREMKKEDVEGVHKLLEDYLKQFQLHVVFSVEEIAHWLLPREGVVNAYVVEDPAVAGRITDLCSFYHLPSTILGHNDTLYAAYSFYNVANSVTLTELMQDCLILAKRGGGDVFNCLNLMQNEEFLTALKFGMGDGQLRYYLYNWSCGGGPAMAPKQVGIVLL